MILKGKMMKIIILLSISFFLMTCSREWDNALDTDNSFVENNFDGVWISSNFNYGFRIEGKQGIATILTSNFSVGDTILHFEPLTNTLFQGEQIFHDELWHQVTGRLLNSRTLEMTGFELIWVMSKV